MKLDIQGLRVLVTAGANGIGLEIARSFVNEGARVHVCDVDDAALAALKHSDQQLTSSKCDVADRAQVAELFKTAIATLGGLDALVNNAGIAGPTGKLEELNPEDWDRCLAVCLTSQFNCARLAIPYLRQSKNASIANLSSAAGKFGFGMRTPYAAAKWGVIGLMKTVAMELGPYGIRANAICPGSVNGPRIDRVIEAEAKAKGMTPDAVRQGYASGTAMKRLTDPEDVAEMALFLASDGARMVSGQALAVDGMTYNVDP